MNTLERALIEKVGRENGWENIIESHDTAVVFASARHQALVTVNSSNLGNLFFEVSSELIKQELIRSLLISSLDNGGIIVSDIHQLALFLHRTAELAQSLPNQAAHTYAERVKETLERTLSNGTEIERLVKQRVGQDTFREALMDYWAGACAVNGISLPAVLRASHAKPSTVSCYLLTLTPCSIVD